MMRVFISLTFCFCALNGAGAAAQEATGQDVDLAKTFSFTEGNRYTLKYVRENFPQLRPKVDAMEKRWDAAFGKAEKNVEARLKEIAGAEWPAIREALINKVLPMLKEQNEGSGSEENGQRYLDLTESRIKGKLESPFLEILLASNPDFIKESALEFTRGYTATFSTKDKPAAKGVKLSLKYPLSWVAKDTGTPNTVQKWTCDAGYGMDSMSLKVRDLKDLPVPAAGLFSEEFRLRLVGESGLELIKFETGEVAKRPVGILHYRYVVPQQKPLTLRGSLYYFVAGDQFVELHQSSATISGKESSKERVEALQELMALVVRSIEVEG